MGRTFGSGDSRLHMSGIPELLTRYVCSVSEPRPYKGLKDKNVLFKDTLHTFYVLFFVFLASDLRLRATHKERERVHCCHLGYSTYGYGLYIMRDTGHCCHFMDYWTYS